MIGPETTLIPVFVLLGFMTPLPDLLNWPVPVQQMIMDQCPNLPPMAWVYPCFYCGRIVHEGVPGQIIRQTGD